MAFSDPEGQGFFAFFIICLLVIVGLAVCGRRRSQEDFPVPAAPV